RLPSVAAVILVVVLTFSALGALAWVLGIQFVSLAKELPSYRGNILARIEKLHVVHRTTAVMNVEKIVKDVAEGLRPDRPGEKPDDAVRVSVETPSMLWKLPSFLQVLGTSAFMTVLVVFILLRRKDLHARVMQLVGEHRLALTTKALDEMGRRITRYLVRQSL